MEFIMRTTPLLAAVAAAGLCSLAACDSKPSTPADPDASTGGAVDAADGPPGGPTMSFFITSKGIANGGDFRRTAADADGLAGADELCRSLAAAANPALGTKPWRAYLSTSAVNAKDRIGAGPWYNQKLVMVAASVADLINPATNKIGKDTGLDEKGVAVPGRDSVPNQHDILTGTVANGLASPNTCANWTSSATTGVSATVGHFDRGGGGNDPASWSSAHATNGCAAAQFPGTGGRGSIYCFVAN
jgi:hypothetical protein